jgi:hypothetical protein
LLLDHDAEGSAPSLSGVKQTQLSARTSQAKPAAAAAARSRNRVKIGTCYFIGNQTSMMLRCDPPELEVFSIFHLYPETPNDLPIIRAST